MNEEFKKAWKDLRIEYLIWCGMPNLYDGGLCVNRSLEEHMENEKHPRAKLMI